MLTPSLQPVIAALTSLTIVTVLGCADLTASQGESEKTPSVHRISDKELPESSGLVKSRTYDDVYWTHNDSGDSARFFAIDSTGATLAKISVRGASHVDWEDIAIDNSGHLYLGDMGNNGSRRRDLKVYRVAEPDPRSGTTEVSVEHVLRFRYADQVIGKTRPNFDCESLLWFSGSLYLFTKHRADTKTHVYRLLDQPGGQQVLEPLSKIDLGGEVRSMYGNTTAADITADGRRVALLTYDGIHIFERGGDDFLPLERVAQIRLDMRSTRQAESLAWDGETLVFGNEQKDLYRLPDPLAPKWTHYPLE